MLLHWHQLMCCTGTALASAVLLQVLLDSVQTVAAEGSTAGSVSALKEVGHALMKLSKAGDGRTSVLAMAYLTKEGAIAGICSPVTSLIYP